MRSILIIFIFFIICSCDNNTATSNYSGNNSAENDQNSFENIIKREEAANKFMDERAKIVSRKVKTTSSFEEYYEIVVENVSDKVISDLQINYLSWSNIKIDVSINQNTFSTSVNLKPGKSISITTMSAPKMYKIYINKIRYQDGEIVSR